MNNQFKIKNIIKKVFFFQTYQKFMLHPARLFSYDKINRINKPKVINYRRKRLNVFKKKYFLAPRVKRFFNVKFSGNLPLKHTKLFKKFAFKKKNIKISLPLRRGVLLKRLRLRTLKYKNNYSMEDFAFSLSKQDIFYTKYVQSTPNDSGLSLKVLNPLSLILELKQLNSLITQFITRKSGKIYLFIGNRSLRKCFEKVANFFPALCERLSIEKMSTLQTIDPAYIRGSSSIVLILGDTPSFVSKYFVSQNFLLLVNVNKSLNSRFKFYKLTGDLRSSRSVTWFLAFLNVCYKKALRNMDMADIFFGDPITSSKVLKSDSSIRKYKKSRLSRFRLMSSFFPVFNKVRFFSKNNVAIKTKYMEVEKELKKERAKILAEKATKRAGVQEKIDKKKEKAEIRKVAKKTSIINTKNAQAEKKSNNKRNNQKSENNLDEKNTKV